MDAGWGEGQPSLQQQVDAAKINDNDTPTNESAARTSDPVKTNLPKSNAPESEMSDFAQSSALATLHNRAATKNPRKRVQQTCVAQLFCTPIAHSPTVRLSASSLVQHSATVKVRNSAIYSHFVRFRATAVIAFIHAGKVRVWGVVAQSNKRICKPSVVGSNPTTGSILCLTQIVVASPSFVPSCVLCMTVNAHGTKFSSNWELIENDLIRSKPSGTYYVKAKVPGKKVRLPECRLAGGALRIGAATLHGSQACSP